MRSDRIERVRKRGRKVNCREGRQISAFFNVVLLKYIKILCKLHRASSVSRLCAAYKSDCLGADWRRRTGGLQIEFVSVRGVSGSFSLSVGRVCDFSSFGRTAPSECGSSFH